MAGPNPQTSEMTQAEQHVQSLKNISEAFEKKIQAIEELDDIFAKDSREFDKLIDAIDKKRDQGIISNQANLLKKKFEKAKKTINDDLQGLTRDLEQKILQAPTEKKAGLRESLSELNVKRQELDEKLKESIEKRSKELDEIAKTTDGAKARKLKAEGFGTDLETQLTDIKKAAADKSAEIIDETLTDDILSQVKGFVLENPNDYSSISAGKIGGTLAAIPVVWEALKKRLKDTGTDSLSGIATAPAGETIGTVKNVPGMIEGGILQTKNVLVMFEGLLKGMAGIPLRIMDFAVKKGLEVKQDNFDFLNKLEEMQNTFAGKSGIGKNFEDLNATLKETRRLAYLTGFEKEGRTTLYGALGDELIRTQIQETGEIIKAMGPYAEMMSESVTRNIKEADARVSDYYYKAKKLMNLSDEDILSLTNRAVALGKTFPDVFHEISKATSDAAKKFGLDFKLMSADVLTLRKNITDFAHKSADELATVVANVRRMGVSLNDAMSVFSRVDSFETAATTAAQLNQTFGMVIDSMELLKAESPDEILQQYKDAFEMSGKSFENMNRFERSLILQQTGLSEQAAQAIFSLENAGKTYEEVMSDINQKDPTAEQISHMEEMDHAIQRNYQVLNDYNGMMNMVAKTMNEKMFKENQGLRDSFEAAANSAQTLNYEIGTMKNTFEKGAPLDKAIQPFTQKVDEINKKMLADKDVLLNPLKDSIKESGNLIEGMAEKNQAKVENSLKKILKTTQDFNTAAIKIGSETALDVAQKVIENAGPVGNAIKESAIEGSIKSVAAPLTPENIKKVLDIKSEAEKVIETGKNTFIEGINAITPEIEKLLKGESSVVDKLQNIFNLNNLIKLQELSSQNMQMQKPDTTPTINNQVKIPQQIQPNQNERSIFEVNGSQEIKQEINKLNDKIDSSTQIIQIELKLDGETLATQMVKRDLVTKMTNPNLTNGRSTLNANAVNTKNGAIIQNTYQS
jgi:hypothetical protein